MDYLPNAAVKAEAQKLLRILVNHALSRTSDIASTVHTIHLTNNNPACISECMKDIANVCMGANALSNQADFSPLSQWWMDESDGLHYQFTPAFAQFVASLCKKTRMMSLVIPATDTLH